MTAPRFSRRRRLSHYTAIVIATLSLLLSNFAGVAFATLPGSSFDGTDGVLDDDGDLLMLTDMACGSGDDDAPINGNTTKLNKIHDDNPPTIEVKTLGTPKADICDVWIDSEVVDGDFLLYVAWSRVATNGSTVVFWEFHNEPLTCASAAPDCNPFDPRSDGDFLLTYDFQGNEIELAVRFWNEAANSFDPPSMVIPTDSEASLSDDTSFGEAVLNLSHLNIIDPNSDDCESFSGVIPGSITGNSDTADYKDIVLTDANPGITNCGNVVVEKVVEGGNDFGQDFDISLSNGDGLIHEEGLGHGDSYTVVDQFEGDDFEVSEDVPANWDVVGIECSDGSSTDGASLTGISVVAGETTTCTVTNAPDLPTITLEKTAVGANIDEGDFQAILGGGNVDWDATTEVAPGDHEIAEAIANGSNVESSWFDAGDWSCDNGDGGAADGATVSVGLGDDVTCSITNTELPSTLTLHKIVNNDDGGNDTQDDFQARIDGDAVDWDQSYDVDALVEHVASEDNPFPGYTPGTWVGDCAADGTVTLDPGQDGHCTITNDDNPPMVTVLKDVTNDDGGQAEPGDFDLLVDGSSASHGDTVVVPANTDIGVDENDLPGYEQTGISCDDGTSIDGDGGVTLNLDEGEHVTCTVFNDDLPASITVVKTVVNDDGGDAVADDFQAYLNGNPVDWNVSNELPAGDYMASEDTLAGYTPSDWGGDCAADGNVSLANGEHLTCTITNDDVAPTVTVIKDVINDDGGNEEPGDFTLHVDDADLTTGDTVEVDANTDVVVGEDQLPGYVLLSIDCDDGTSLEGENLDVTLNLDEGEDVTCTITNDDLPPAITIVKEVINDNGGDAEAGDFDLFLDGEPVTSGDANDTTANEPHEASEAPLDGYAQISLNCVDDDTAEQVAHPVVPNEGQHVTCTIINDDLAPGLTVFKQVINDDGATATPEDFTLLINGNEHSHGSHMQVLANFDHEVGEEGLEGYELVDIQCTDGTSLEPGATTVVVNLDEGEAVGCTVVNDDLPAEVEVVKDATDGVVDDGEGNLVATFDPTDNDDETVTYTYVLTNTGEVALENVTLVDDILGPIELPQTTLEPGESISVTAVHTLSDDDPNVIVNVATVTGDPVHGAPTVDDNDDETVSVVEVEPKILEQPVTGADSARLLAIALLLVVGGLGILGSERLVVAPALVPGARGRLRRERG